ncbi:MAG: phosphatase PAP2 family protein [Spirochaetales bacterium]|nr:phosphatase PAP2 family protein [Spirochaetales bacterium]
MNIKKKTIIAAAVLLFLHNNLFCQSISEGEKTYSEDAFRLSFEVDLPVLAGGAALFITEFLVSPVSGQQQSIDDLFFLDRISINPYNSVLDSACEYLLGASLLLPALTLVNADFDALLEVGLMFVETMLLTYSAKDLLKDWVPRYRPYTYLAAPVDDDYMNSFPSGHTAALFAISGFTSYVFCEMYPGSGWNLPVVIGSYSLAATTGILRVASGNHFVTDVLAGAIMGTIFGIGVPMLHSLDLKEQTGISVSGELGSVPHLTVSCQVKV